MKTAAIEREVRVSDPHQPLLSVEGIMKSFPGDRVLDGISLDVRSGEVHVLFGKNGAGKSTLVNVILGNYAPDNGQVRLNGKVLVAGSPKSAREHGESPRSGVACLARGDWIMARFSSLDDR